MLIRCWCYRWGLRIKILFRLNFIIKFQYALRIGDHLNLQLTSDINSLNILEPSCTNGIPKPNEDVESDRRSLSEKSSNAHWCRVIPLLDLWLSNKLCFFSFFCMCYYINKYLRYWFNFIQSYNHMLCSVWANNKGVQEALGVRPVCVIYSYITITSPNIELL